MHDAAFSTSDDGCAMFVPKAFEAAVRGVDLVQPSVYATVRGSAFVFLHSIMMFFKKQTLFF